MPEMMVHRTSREARAPDMIIHRRSVTRVFVLGKTQTQFVFNVLLFFGCAACSKGQETSEKEGGGKQLVFEDRIIICLQPPTIYLQGNTWHP